MQAAEGQRESVSVYGSDYETPDGTCLRDYIHINDLAEAHLKGLDFLSHNNSPFKHFNLGNGKGFSVLEVIREIKKITGSDFQVKQLKRRDGDPAVLIASSKRAKNYLNFAPKFNDLAVIIDTLLPKDSES